jgi:hypothetical protein
MTKFYGYDGFSCDEVVSIGIADVDAPVDSTKLWNWNGIYWVGLPLNYSVPATVNRSPVYVTPEEPLKTIYDWYIDVGPYYDRFSYAKMAVLTSTDMGIQAIIKDSQVRKWIDLKRPDVAASLEYIGSKIPLVSAALKKSILTTHVSSDENLVLRKLYFS